LKTEFEITVAIEIDAPRDAVWAIVSDPERLPEWMEEMEAAHQESNGPPGLGSVVRYTLAPGHLSGTFEVVEWEPASTLAWDGPPLPWLGGGLRPRGSFELADADGGRTRFTGRYRPELSGAQVLLRPYLKWWARRARRASTLKLKEMAEAEPAS
jgi:uncharacterized protein YndB with AHSA1/START domain